MDEHATSHRVWIYGKVPVLIQDGPLDTPCHVWQGCIDNEGYARRGHHGKPATNAHRDIYIEKRGGVPGGYVLHHWCENKLCLNVDHMEAVTRGDHVRIHRKGKPMVGGWQSVA